MAEAYSGKVVAITGGAGGIGATLARRFAEAGARVALLDVDGARLGPVVEDLRRSGHDARDFVCDITSLDACAEAFARIDEGCGGVDVLVNNAGITHFSTFAETDVAVLRRVMEINFFGAVHCTKVALPSITARRGAIAVLSSVAGFAPLYTRSGYCASKFALHGLFETLRTEVADAGVHVLMVCPTFIATEMERRALGADGGEPKRRRTTTGAAGKPEDVADALLDGLARKRRLVVVGGTGRLARILSRISPAAYDRMMLSRIRER